jgi:hypothetical protein
MNIDSYLLMKHIYDAVSIGMVLTAFLDETDIKKRDEFLVFSVMFIFYVSELERNNKLMNL